MEVKVQIPVYIREIGKVELREILVGDIGVKVESILSIDGSTTNTGMAILTKEGNISYILSFRHEKDKENEIQYKVRMKRVVCNILRENGLIREVFYEEPFIGYTKATKSLLMLRTFIEEIVYENEPDFNYIRFTEINNLRWKRLFLEPEKCPTGTGAQKAAVKNKLLQGLPLLEKVTQDEIDAICMGFVAVKKLSEDNRKELETKQKARAFKYEIQFIGADSDEGLMVDFADICEAPDIVLQAGISLINLGVRGKLKDFDQLIYDMMDKEDKLLILKFPSNKYGNIVLKYRLGHLMEYDYIYALVWRKSRKRV